MYNLNRLYHNTLITANEVVFHAPTKHTLDARTIEQSIIIAEERFIRPELGQEMYDGLRNQKNNLVTTLNKSDLQGKFEAYTLQEGDVVNAFEFMTADNQTLWKEHLWKLTAECVMIMATPEAFVQFGTEGVIHSVPTSSPMITNGSVTPELRSIKWIMDQKQYRIDALIKSLHAYLCLNKTKYTLYTKNCPCDSREVRKSNVILGLYDDEPENCRCYERRTYH